MLRALTITLLLWASAVMAQRPARSMPSYGADPGTDSVWSMSRVTIGPPFNSFADEFTLRVGGTSAAFFGPLVSNRDLAGMTGIGFSETSDGSMPSYLLRYNSSHPNSALRGRAEMYSQNGTRFTGGSGQLYASIDSMVFNSYKTTRVTAGAGASAFLGLFSDFGTNLADQNWIEAIDNAGIGIFNAFTSGYNWTLSPTGNNYVRGVITSGFLADSTLDTDVRPLFSDGAGNITPNTIDAPVRGRYSYVDGMRTPYLELNGASYIGAIGDTAIRVVSNDGDVIVTDASRKVTFPDPAGVQINALATGGVKKLVTVDSLGKTDTVSFSAGGLFVATVGATWPLGSTGGLNPTLFIAASSGTGRVVRDTGAFLYNITTNKINVGGGAIEEDVGFVGFTGVDFYFEHDLIVLSDFKTYGGITSDSAIRQKIRYQDADSILVLPGNQVVYTNSAPEGGFKAQLLAASVYGAADYTGCIEFSDARGVYGSYRIYPAPGETIEGADDDGTPGSPLTLVTKYGYAKVCRTAGGADRTWFVPQKK